MTSKEQELIYLIRCHSAPNSALETAICIITDFLMQHGSSEEQDPDSLVESV